MVYGECIWYIVRFGVIWYNVVWHNVICYLRVRDCCVSKFCILHSAPATSCSIQNFSFIVYSARACICKQNTNLTVSNTFNI